jgi:hypothetical protein
MCVIMIADEVRPSESAIARGFAANPSGAGIAWRDTHEGEPVVRWIKGVMNLPDIQDLVKTTPLPFIVHFRIPTVGGSIPDLTHPFPIHEKTTNSLKGATKGAVLFHNGHWREWQEKMMESAIKGNAKLPVGKWSDSRAMAWIAARHGLGMLEFIANASNRVVAFGPKGIQIFGETWDEVDGILVSNKSWCFRATGSTTTVHTRSPWTTPPASLAGKSVPVTSSENTIAISGKAGGTSQEPSFRNGPTTVRSGEVVEEEAEAGSLSLREAHAEAEGSGETGDALTDKYFIKTGHKKSDVQKLIDQILSQRDAPTSNDTINEAERVLVQPSLADQEAWRWAAGKNKPHHLVDPRKETLTDADRTTRLREHRQGISRVIN